ncbi:hypothetical protein [Hymenobacter yonginensis]|uniref:YD repeat-containing protein n=1 Tax=Hymenobacter yonginensis TaxID=748197 RepID=A0ABY7PMK8_9BACT|nr:hypothetical protein [Hymenobacter yonginensis]WBO84485.1 hypothetical protein O9Z63_19215 [Hymenobacter yonginensis]
MEYKMHLTIKKQLFDTLLLIGIGILLPVAALAQERVYRPTWDNMMPVAPSAFQFAKYADVPVNEYTGIPDISVPIHDLVVDDITIPIRLQYHSGGIKVSEEASWVGLGWDMQFGSVVQMVNDCDDYGTRLGNPIEKLLPAYIGNPVPYRVPLRYQYPFSIAGQAWSNPYPVIQPQPVHAFCRVVDNFAPFQSGEFNTQVDWAQGESLDTEPDVFKANFFGHSLNFIRDFATGNIVVLNKKGYLVRRNSNNASNSDSWEIITPNGDLFIFSERIVSETKSFSDGFEGPLSWNYKVSSKTWMISEVKTKNKKSVRFSYNRSPVHELQPSFSQRWVKVATDPCRGYSPNSTGYSMNLSATPNAGLQIPTVPTTYTTKLVTRQDYLLVSRIDFPQGFVNFELSSRDDLEYGKKLDKIVVSSDFNRKEFAFNYSYFNSSQVGGNGFSVNDVNGNYENLRLKLLSFKEIGAPEYVFHYNQTSLPRKRSFAQDIWGNYNGALSNQSLILNPSYFKRPEIGVINNNVSANPQTAQACVLQSMQYPTGGHASFFYELNQFDNYWVPDFANNINSITTGNGLRIRKIERKTANIIEATEYEYYGGISVLHKELFRELFMPTALASGNGISVCDNYISELNSSGYSAANQMGSITGVGYSRVVKKNIKDSMHNGYIVTYFANSPDIASQTASHLATSSVTLPSIKEIDFESNGSVDSVFYYNKNDVLVRKVCNNYFNSKSSIFYGAKVLPHSNYWYYSTWSEGGFWDYKSEILIAFTPIFDIETLLSGSSETNYSGGSAFNIKRYFAYNSLNLQEKITTVVSGNESKKEEVLIKYAGSSDLPANAGVIALLSANRVNQIVSMKRKFINTVNSSVIEREVYSYDRTFQVMNDKIVESTASEKPGGVSTVNPRVYVYEKYDPTNANLLQYRMLNDVPSSMIWSRNDYIMCAVKNAGYSQIAYSSFEPNSTGRFKYDSLYSHIVAGGRTGRYCYRLDSFWGVSRSNLPADTYELTFWATQRPVIYVGQAYASPVSEQIVASGVGSWKQYVLRLNLPANSTINIDAASPNTPILLDEVRLYPARAQMSTFVTEQLRGMTSQSDKSGRNMQYEYDGLSRLLRVRDEQNRVLTEQEYHYARP